MSVYPYNLAGVKRWRYDQVAAFHEYCRRVFGGDWLGPFASSDLSAAILALERSAGFDHTRASLRADDFQKLSAPQGAA